jgi:hypothetical protein
VAPLSERLRERVLDLLRQVQCNGNQAYTTAYLAGIGAPLPVFSSWAASWSTQALRMKYFNGTSADAREQVPHCEVEFGVVTDGLTGGTADIVLAPLVASAIVPSTSSAFSSIVFFVFSQN